MFRVDSRGVFEEISSDNSYRDYILACRILMWDLYDSKKPVKRVFPPYNPCNRDCIEASLLGEVENPHVYRCGWS